jgi:hypothetical protein
MYNVRVKQLITCVQSHTGDVGGSIVFFWNDVSRDNVTKAFKYDNITIVTAIAVIEVTRDWVELASVVR